MPTLRARVISLLESGWGTDLKPPQADNLVPECEAVEYFVRCVSGLEASLEKAAPHAAVLRMLRMHDVERLDVVVTEVPAMLLRMLSGADALPQQVRDAAKLFVAAMVELLVRVDLLHSKHPAKFWGMGLKLAVQRWASLQALQRLLCLDMSAATQHKLDKLLARLGGCAQGPQPGVPPPGVQPPGVPPPGVPPPGVPPPREPLSSADPLVFGPSAGECGAAEASLVGEAAASSDCLLGQ